MTPSKTLYKKLKAHGLDFFVSVPCTLLGGMISLLENDKEVVYTPVTREEEGIGILAGAALAGKRPAILMQNSGLGNSINALCSLICFYQLPIVLVISHRGTEGEKIDAQRPMGKATEKLLETIAIPYQVIAGPEEINLIDSLIEDGFKSGSPTALLFPHSFWKKGEVG